VLSNRLMERSNKFRSPSGSDKEALLSSTTQSLSDIPLDNGTPAATIPSSESTGSLKMNQFLNSMSHRINSNKPKYGNFQSNFLSKARSFCSARVFFWATGLFISGYIFLYYFEFISSSSSLLTSPFNLGDRSSTYRVKVLPSLLSDEELHSLPKESFSYLAMIDAGSSGCRAHIYRYGKLGSIDGPLYVLPQHTSKKIKPGLSSFANNPNDAGLSLGGLVDFMKEQVPEEDWSVTPIWLKATAGLRMLPSSQSEAILDSIRKFLLNSKNSPFYFRYSWARIISGNEEGGFGWIAFNYLKKLIGPKKTKTTTQPQVPFAVIEMGGASAQVSQVAPSVEEAQKIPPEFRFSFDIEGEEYHLYTHSYLGYGAEQAKEQFYRLLKQQTAKTTVDASPAVSLLSKDPCKHEGFVSPAQQRRKLIAEHRAARGLFEDSHNSTVDRILSSISSSLSSSSSASSADLNPTCVQCVASLFTTITSFGTSLLNDASSALSSISSAVSSSVSSPSSPLASNNLCSTPGPHSFGCVYQPEFVTNSPNILAFENFYYMSSALGVKPHKNHRNLASVIEKSNISDVKAISAVATTFPLETTPYQIKEASETFCALPWNDVQAHYPKDTQGKDVNMKTCFISAFSYSFLVDGLKIPHNKVITIQREVDNSEIEWALGAAYKETADFLKRSHLRPT
jgi:Golgi nucleoside diphosphatase